MKIIIKIIISIFIISNSYANDAYQIMKKVETQSQKIQNQQYSVFMEIVNDNGKVRKRYFEILKKISHNYSKSLIKFYKPANIKNTALLNHNKLNVDKDPTQWLFLPAFRTLKQISSENSNDSFMGSDFTILDMAGRAPEKDNFEIVKETNDNFIIKAIPKNQNDNYGMMVYLISKEYYLPLTIEFYDKELSKIKVLNNYNIKKDHNMFFSSYSVMENKKQSSKTTLTIEDNNFDIKISENDVGVMALK